jgi:hypothetical protein
MRAVRQGPWDLGVLIRRDPGTARVQVGPRVVRVLAVQVPGVQVPGVHTSRMGPSVLSVETRVDLHSGVGPGLSLGTVSRMRVGHPGPDPAVRGKAVRSQGLVVRGERLRMWGLVAGPGVPRASSEGLDLAAQIGVPTARAGVFAGNGPGTGMPRRGGQDRDLVGLVLIVRPGCSMPQDQDLRGDRSLVPRGNSSRPRVRRSRR